MAVHEKQLSSQDYRYKHGPVVTVLLPQVSRVPSSVPCSATNAVSNLGKSFISLWLRLLPVRWSLLQLPTSQGCCVDRLDEAGEILGYDNEGL